jgi:glutathione peroxidase-family protein
MHAIRIAVKLAALLITTSTFCGILAASEVAARAGPAPAFTQTDPAAWINSEPLTVERFGGQVLLIDVWTFGCWNCYRSFPWLNALEARFGPRGLRIVGVHSPEFDHERDRAAVEAKIREFDLEHPVMLDNDFRYWNALGNRAWPAFYLVDKDGLIRGRFVGETHAGDRQATQIEARIEQLLSE